MAKTQKCLMQWKVGTQTKMIKIEKELLSKTMMEAMQVLLRTTQGKRRLAKVQTLIDSC